MGSGGADEKRGAASWAEGKGRRRNGGVAGAAAFSEPLARQARYSSARPPPRLLSLFILDLPEGRTPTAMAPLPEGTVAAARLPPSLPLPLTPALRGEGTEKEDDGGSATLSLNPGGGSATSKSDGSPAPLSPLIVFSSLLLPSNRGGGASVGSGQEAASRVSGRPAARLAPSSDASADSPLATRSRTPTRSSSTPPRARHRPTPHLLRRSPASASAGATTLSSSSSHTTHLMAPYRDAAHAPSVYRLAAPSAPPPPRRLALFPQTSVGE